MSRPIATNTTVCQADLIEFIKNRHRAVLVTTRADGSPQISPVTAGYDDGAIVIATYPDRAKVANLRRFPEASVVVLSDDWNGPWVQVDGAAEVIDAPASVEPLVGYYRAISGEHPDWDEYRAAMVRDRRLVVRLHPERAYGIWPDA